ncbi:MAG: PTS sugar transporter subunit IIA [Planctomycetes bacterium]|nr:PTS sugar transporter subunit IIA [Planctomycetota bacterium]
MTVLSKLLTPERITWLVAAEKKAALRELVHVIATAETVGNEEGLYAAILEREDLLSTGIGFGLAIPHAKVAHVRSYTLALGISKPGIDYGSMDDERVQILLMVAGPEGRQEDYLRILARISRFLKGERERILSLEDATAIHELTRQY